MLVMAGVVAGTFLILVGYAIIAEPDDDTSASLGDPVSEEIEVLTATPARDGSVKASSTKKSAAPDKGAAAPAATANTATLAPPEEMFPRPRVQPPPAETIVVPPEPKPLRPPAQPFVK